MSCDGWKPSKAAVDCKQCAPKRKPFKRIFAGISDRCYEFFAALQFGDADYLVVGHDSDKTTYVNPRVPFSGPTIFLPSALVL